MDRLTGRLDRSDESLQHGDDDGVIGFGSGEEHVVERASTFSRIDRQLFELSELDVL